MPSEIGENVVTVCSFNSINGTLQIGYVLTTTWHTIYETEKGPRFIFN